MEGFMAINGKSVQGKALYVKSKRSVHLATTQLPQIVLRYDAALPFEYVLKRSKNHYRVRHLICIKNHCFEVYQPTWGIHEAGIEVQVFDACTPPMECALGQICTDVSV